MLLEEETSAISVSTGKPLVLDLREKAIKMPDCHFQSSLYFKIEEREGREY